MDRYKGKAFKCLNKANLNAITALSTLESRRRICLMFIVLVREYALTFRVPTFASPLRLPLRFPSYADTCTLLAVAVYLLREKNLYVRF
jgi:hypothetical protein